MPAYLLNKNLLRAIFTLATAFVLAAGAHMFYRHGLLPASLTLLSLALILCCYVVVLCVPFILRWSPSAWRILPASFRLTREGVAFVAAVFVVAAAAAISGNNLIYLVLSCMLAAMVLSGLVSRLGLAGLQLNISFPHHIFAKQRSLARVTVRNLKRWMPSFSIWVGAGPASPDTSKVIMEEFYCPMITGGSAAVASLPMTFPRRGRYKQGSFWLRSRFPLSFVERRARLELSREVLVYPPVEPSPEVEEITRRLGQLSQGRSKGDSHDLYRIRPSLPDDNARLVDWKASARARGLMVREFVHEDHCELDIVFDRTVPAGPEWSERFEKAVYLCAAVSWRLHGMNAEIHFASDECSILSSPNSAAIYEILRYLALVEPVAGGPGRRPRDASPNAHERFQLIFTARPKEELPPLQFSQGYYFLLEKL